MRWWRSFAEQFQAVPVPPEASAPAMVLARLDAGEPLVAAGLSAAPKGSVAFGSPSVACTPCRVGCVRGDAALLTEADL